MLDRTALAAERRRFLVATRGVVYVPLAGIAFWGLLGVAGAFWTERTWCLVVLYGAAVAVAPAVVLLVVLVRRLEAKSPLATVVLPALVPVGLSLATAAAAYRADPSLVPLVLGIGFGSHWPVVGWSLGTRVYTVHAAIRGAVAVGLWFAVPAGRFTVLPFALAAVYAGTSAFVLRALRTAGPVPAGP